MSRKILFAIIGAIALICILVGIGVFVLLPHLTTTAAATVQTPTPVVTATAKPASPLAQALKQYGPDIKGQIAQGLHLTPDQLRTQLRSGQSLSAIASAQNVSSTQLQTLVQTAVTNGLQPAVADGSITQKQVDNLAKGYLNNSKRLERFLGAGAKAA